MPSEELVSFASALQAYHENLSEHLCRKLVLTEQCRDCGPSTV